MVTGLHDLLLTRYFTTGKNNLSGSTTATVSDVNEGISAAFKLWGECGSCLLEDGESVRHLDYKTVGQGKEFGEEMAYWFHAVYKACFNDASAVKFQKLREKFVGKLKNA